MPTHTKDTVYLRLPKHAVDAKAKPYWMVQIAITTTVISVAILTLLLIIPSLRWIFAIALAAALVIGSLCLFIVPHHLFRYHRWEVTGEAVYASSGWMWREWRIAPLSRIQTVDTQYGPLLSAFGLATVVVTTASAAGPIKIVGLNKMTAAELTEKLTSLTEAAKGDAT